MFALHAGAIVAAFAARPALARSAAGAIALLAAAVIATGLASWLDWYDWRAILAPQDSGQAAVVYALLALHVLLFSTGALMASFVAARGVAGLLTQPRSNTLDLTMLFIIYAAAQGLIGSVVARLAG